MGWFDEQIKQRKLNDDELMYATYSNLAGSILGRKVVAALSSGSAIARDAMNEVIKYYRLEKREVPEDINDFNEQLEYVMRPTGIMRRNVRLKKGWHKDAAGAMLGTRSDDGSVVALIPKGFRGYSFFDVKTGKRVTVNAKNEKLLDDEAVVFYKPFPLRKMTMKDLMAYILSCISVADIAVIMGITLLVTIVGMFVPAINRELFADVTRAGNLVVLVAIGVFLFSVIVGKSIITAAQGMMNEKVNAVIDMSVEAASMMRILSLPAHFFKKYSSGELSNYLSQIGALSQTIVAATLSMGLTSVFSLLYVSQIFAYTPALVWPALSLILLNIIMVMSIAFAQQKYTHQLMLASAKESGLSYQLIAGITKIRLAGAEKRAFSKWGEKYAIDAGLEYNPPLLIKYKSTIMTFINMLGTIILYYCAAFSDISVADYYAFNSVYGILSAAFLALASVALTVAKVKPIVEIVKPIMDAVPEISENKHVVTRVSGAIELSHVSFKYAENMPNVLDDLNLKIKAGQYVAIVGKTGCGKSTLMRLLLGFEKPDKGAVYYDNRDIETLDLKSLRRRIGTVMQSGRLFSGDIYSNIVIAAPYLTLDEAWEAARIAGIAEDIENMPMGMNTLISEGAGGISGGQRQRLMIARAVAPKPKILMFDEATSALDNITQKKVAQSLDALKCTRIVIAHRLSTIKHCDRIIVLDGGKIIEDGKFDELVAAGGFFSELVERQLINEPAKQN